MRAGAGRHGGKPVARRVAAGLTAASVAVLAAVTTAPAARAADGPPVTVILEADSSAAARAAVVSVGGAVEREIPLIGAVAAQVPARSVAALRAAPGVTAVSQDGRLRLSAAGADRWESGTDQVSMGTVTETIGAADVWRHDDRSGHPLTGSGVGVALIDSGVTPVKGLNDADRITNGPDLSFESQAPNLRYLDTYGHGTHMAGIIAGRDPEVRAGRSASSTQHFAGVAPDADLLNVKVAAADGAVDVSQVIAAIDWVVQHRHDQGMNIRVLNLSFGTDSRQDVRLDPLSHAVEAAWKHGIVVVVAAGNDGPSAGRLTMPAANPFVLAVGASDTHGTAERGDDTVAAFSSSGDTSRSPDLVAPGKSVVSLRNPGSYVDVTYPSGLIPGDTEQRFFRGSGTSQAAAVTSGAVALLLQRRPSLTPDQVKYVLTHSARKVKDAPATVQGAGLLDIEAAIAARPPKAATAAQTHLPSLGTGSLEASRGSSHVVDPLDGTVLTGEQDIMGTAWDGRTWSSAATEGRTWSGAVWNGRTWSGDAWTGSSWTGRTWSGAIWSGNTWSGRTWSGRTWSGAVWNGRTWSGAVWNGRTWSGDDWNGRTWSGAVWNGAVWSGAVWNGRTWSVGSWR